MAFFPGTFRKLIWVIVPIIALGGLFYPILGLPMLPMMVFLLVLSYFKGRYWCGNLCPRGSFLDFLIRPISADRLIPGWMRSAWFRWGFLTVFMTVFVVRTIFVFNQFDGWNAWLQWGYVFATLCLVTTTVAIFLGLFYNPRTWCSFCPMGTLQNSLYSAGNHVRSEKRMETPE